MREIGYQARIEAIEWYLQGLSTNEVVEKTSISKGAVVSILAEARQGKLPVPGLKDRVDELHALSVKLKKETHDPAQARLGMVFAARLLRLGVDMAKLEAWLEFGEQLSPNPPEGFWEAAAEFHNLAVESGQGYPELLAEVKSLAAQRESLTREVAGLKSMEKRVGDVKAELDESKRECQTLRANRDGLKLEAGQLTDLLKRKAAALGISLAELESRLKELLLLGGEIAAAKRERDRLKGEMEALEERQRQLSARIEKAGSDFQADLELWKSARKDLVEIGQMKGRLEQEIKGMEWAVKVIPFITDPENAPDKDLNLIASVINCLERWLAVQPEFRYRKDPLWSEVKRHVHSKRMQLQGAIRGAA